MILIQGCDAYAPDALGTCDVLIAATRVERIAEHLGPPGGIPCDVIRAEGLRLIPGLIDGHIHIAGAGGEGGPATRTREVHVRQLLDAGVTTVLGCLGTDGLTRSLESVLMKVKALRAEGMSAWMLTGSYQVPPPSILEHVGRDVAMIDEVIGVGEIAIADHRSSGATVEELIRLATQARVGGLLGGKAGIVSLHVGGGRNPFQIVYDAVERSELPITQFWPTHCGRSGRTREAAIAFGRRAAVDITAGTGVVEAVLGLREAGVPLEHITISSDGCGSLPRFDATGNLVSLTQAEPRGVFTALIDLVRRGGLPWEEALRMVTLNAASVLKLSGKGRIAEGVDADLVLLDEQDRIRHVIARGEILVRDGERTRRDAFGE